MLESLVPLLLDWGYFGLFVAAFIAGSLLPLGSEAIFLLLVAMGLDPAGCLLAATAGNTLGGMSCYWIGSLGDPRWIARLGVGRRRLARVRLFLRGRGSLAGFFAFLPLFGEAIAVALGLMRSNVWLTAASMCCGKFVRYLALLLPYLWAKG